MWRRAELSSTRLVVNVETILFLFSFFFPSSLLILEFLNAVEEL